MTVLPRVAPSKDVVDAWSREPNLDLLRTIAVLCVVARHVSGALEIEPRWWFQPQALGIFGVLIFFVHTSLVLMLSLDRQRRGARISFFRLYVAFLIRRFFRIYPLSITAVLLTYFVLIPLSDPSASAAGINVNASRWDLVANLLLIQDLAGLSSVLGPLWSLPAEVQMYFILPFLFLLIERRGTWVVAIFIWPAAVALALFTWTIDLRMTVGLYAPCFVAGVLCYGWLRKERPLPFYFFPVWILALLLAYMILYALFRLQAGLGILVTLALACSLPFCARMTSPALRRVSHAIAKYSYGIYLFHTPCIWIAFGKWSALGLVGSSLCMVILVAATSVTSYLLIEEPFIRVGRSLTTKISGHQLAMAFDPLSPAP